MDDHHYSGSDAGTNRLRSANSLSTHFTKWKINNRLNNAEEKNFAFALSELERLSASNNLSRTVKESAFVIYRRAIAKNLVRGRSTEEVMAASIYAACRICDAPRTIDEIAKTSVIPKKQLGRTYRFMKKQLHLDLQPAKPQNYIRRYTSLLNLSDNVAEKATEILDEVCSKSPTSGIGPAGLAAGAVYIAAIQCGEHMSQNKMAASIGITKVTLRCRYKDLSSKLGIRIDFNE